MFLGDIYEIFKNYTNPSTAKLNKIKIKIISLYNIKNYVRRNIPNNTIIPELSPGDNRFF